MLSKSYIVQFTPNACCDDSMHHMREFAMQGSPIKACATLTSLVHHVSTVQDAENLPVVVIVDGRNPDSANAVATLRSLQGDVGIVAMVDRHDDAAMVHMLHSGVDICSFVGASPDLWVATVSRLLWRLGQRTQQGSTRSSETLASWELMDKGWTLRTPNGQFVTLTTGERAFLTTLLNSPAQKATHAQLISAVNASYNYADARSQQSRLGVMVSRMRRKFEQAGTPLPLKSVHNWGYMFISS